MLDYDGVSLFSSGSLMSHGVEWSLNVVDGHSIIMCMIDTDPPESYSLQLPL